MAYAAGMGLIVGTAALSVALTRTARVGRLRRLGSVASRTGGGLLFLVGAYVAYYGWYEIRVQRAPATQDPVIDGPLLARHHGEHRLTGNLVSHMCRCR
ncbi:hypothetical protein [Streptomyces sp. A012304]|uniref:hypothetical protein n=1 Tax=Streptomyces sp. A012304 TaxID=375446 RepID=UPI0022300026|nr:hypothetical protein [Streptomyces sp. A012304]GKQ42053.1 hypothetical protein ALMP_85650 [Streptomyces sp. A012304]